MSRPRILVLTLGLLATAAAVNSCRPRISESTAVAQSATAPNWNGRDCFFGSSMRSIDRLNYLELGVTSEIKPSSRRISDANSWESRAIVAAFGQNFGSGQGGAQGIVSDLDDDVVYFSRILVHLEPGRYPIPAIDPSAGAVKSDFFQVTATAGDTWIGAVVQRDTPTGGGAASVKVVAEYGDGDTFNCSLTPRPTRQQRVNAVVRPHLCAFGDNTTSLERSLSRSNGVWRPTGAPVTLKPSSRISQKYTQEIMKGWQIRDFDPVASVQEAIETTDDEEIVVQEMVYTKTGKSYRWYLFYGGDNSVGFFFGDEGYVAAVGDGDIADCRVKKVR